jgi:acetyltransferase-like isoleucine patch superfamily enzyme
MNHIEPSADVAIDAMIGTGTNIWHLAQVRENAVVGSECNVGRGAYIGPGVRLGDRCKIQNYALVYEPAVLADGVFIGPAVILTNDLFPRAINPDGTLKVGSDWEMVGVNIGTGAAIGAGATCIAPLSIGKWSIVAAGSVVTKNVPDYAMVAGVPARQIGWAGEAGHPLRQEEDWWVCPRTERKYLLHNEVLRPVAP